MAQHDTVIAQLDGKIENETKLHQEVSNILHLQHTLYSERLHCTNVCIMYILCSMLQCT